MKDLLLDSDRKLGIDKDPTPENDFSENQPGDKSGRRQDERGNESIRRRENMIIGESQFYRDSVSSIKAYQRKAETCSNLSVPPPSDNIPNDTNVFEEEEVVRID